MDKIKEYAKLAQEILGNNTAYAHDKKMISDIFKVSDIDNFEKIKLRLTIIDSYYSTQMSKRLFGIEEIAKEIETINDKDLSEMFLNFLKNPDKEEYILKLFNLKFGCNKVGKKIKTAPSLISKYAYFLTNFKFPIYDSLAKISYDMLQKKYSDMKLEKLENNDIKGYFNKIKNLNEITGINDYDVLDNFLWLYGKLTQGSFSLILKKENYLELVNSITFKSRDSRGQDLEISQYIKSNLNNKKLSEIFSH